MKLKSNLFPLYFLIGVSWCAIENLGNEVSKKEDQFWIEKLFQGQENLAKMHAFIVRDENVPSCGVPAQDVTSTRYFMCSGIVVSEIHVLTTASCIHYAYVYKHYMEADVAVQIGLSPGSSYVIGINHYEVHPKHNDDIDSPNYASHNLALLHLACQIPSTSLALPKFPVSLYDDVAHKCCPDRCKLLTVVQYSDNHQRVKIMTAKHLPAPIHEEMDSEGKSLRRKMRETAGNGSTTGKPMKTTKVEEATKASIKSVTKSKEKTKRPSSSRRRAKKKKKQEVDALLSILEGPKSSSRRGKGNKGDESAKPPKDANWQDSRNSGNASNGEMKEMNREAAPDFMKELAGAIVHKIKSAIDGVAGHGISTNVTSTREEISSRLFGENKSLDYIADVFAKTIMETTLMKPNASSVGDDREEFRSRYSPSAKYESCPPLGTPVLSNDFLVGMIAYTCDDAQSWVEWKYVNIAKNVNWIRKKLNLGTPNGQNISETF